MHQSQCYTQHHKVSGWVCRPTGRLYSISWLRHLYTIAILICFATPVGIQMLPRTRTHVTFHWLCQCSELQAKKRDNTPPMSVSMSQFPSPTRFYSFSGREDFARRYDVSLDVADRITHDWSRYNICTLGVTDCATSDRHKRVMQVHRYMRSAGERSQLWYLRPSRSLRVPLPTSWKASRPIHVRLELDVGP
jgi:hypothetical protein